MGGVKMSAAGGGGGGLGGIQVVGDEAADGIKMLVRVGIAVTCSVVAYTVSYFTTRSGGDGSHASGEEDEEKEKEDSKFPQDKNSTPLDNSENFSEEEGKKKSARNVDIEQETESAANVPNSEPHGKQDLGLLLHGRHQDQHEKVGGAEESLQSSSSDGSKAGNSIQSFSSSSDSTKPWLEVRHAGGEEIKNASELDSLGSCNNHDDAGSGIIANHAAEFEALTHDLEQHKSLQEIRDKKIQEQEQELCQKNAQIQELRSHLEELSVPESGSRADSSDGHDDAPSKRDLDTEKKNTNLAHQSELEIQIAGLRGANKELEIEVAGLRNANKELEQQKTQLSEKLSATQADNIVKLADHSKGGTGTGGFAQEENKFSGSAGLIKPKEEQHLRALEGLQSNWFSEVEEFMYLRWVNACLRNELHNHQSTLVNLATMLDVNSKSSSPESVEKAKQLILEYINSEHLLPLRLKDFTEAGLDSSSSDKSLFFSEAGGAVDGDESSSPHSKAQQQHIHRKQSLIRRLRNWTAKHLDAGGSGSESLSSPVSPGAEPNERWFLFHNSDLRHHRRRSSGSLTPSSSSSSKLVPAGSETHNNATMIHKNASDVSSAMGGGGKKIDSNVLSSNSSAPQRTASDSSFLVSGTMSPSSSFSSSSMHHKPNLPLLNTAITEHNNSNGVPGTMSTPIFQLMAKSPASETVKDRLNEALERHKEIKEKARAERERIHKEKDVQEEKKPADGNEPPDGSEEEEKSLNNIVSSSSQGVELGLDRNSMSRVSKMPKPPPKPSGLGPPESKPGFKPSSGQQGLVPDHHHHDGAPGESQSKDDDMPRASEVVELYLSLMKHEDSRSKEGMVMIPGGGDGKITPDANNNTLNIGEIDDRSTHHLAIKADVETHGDFVRVLATQVRVAVYYSIEDVVAVVNWLDEELSQLVDETTVLKHFDWPEGKVDALREAAFEYLDLVKLQEELSAFEDKPELSCEDALKKMLTTLEKVELSVNGLLQTRDMEMARYKEFNIPIGWMLDSGLVGKIKLECVKLVRLCINRVLSELDHEGESAHGEPMQEFLLLQGVRFAFRIHQFVGGFDPETMSAFQALRDRAHIRSTNSL